MNFLPDEDIQSLLLSGVVEKMSWSFSFAQNS
jgi:hypothetical protein